MSTHQHIINHLYELFTYLAEKSSSNLTTEDSYRAISTENSSRPNFIFDINPTDITFIDIAQKIINNKLPQHLILDQNQIDLYENILTENGFFPIAEWSCLSFDNKTETKIQNENLEIKKITTELDLAEWIEVASSGFGGLHLDLFKNCLNHKEFTIYGGYYNNKLVATSLLFNHNHTTGIYHVVTLPEYKGRGFGSEIFTHCQQQAIKNGAKQVIAQSTSEGLNAWINTGMKTYGNFYLFCLNKS